MASRPRPSRPLLIRFPKRGEVYVATLDKARLVVVLSVDALNKHALDVCVVPITRVEHGKFSMRVPIWAGDGGLKTNCWAKCDQVTTLEKTLLRHPPLGMLSPPAFAHIQAQVRFALGLV